jgi:hypothetical protein
MGRRFHSFRRMRVRHLLLAQQFLPFLPSAAAAIQFLFSFDLLVFGHNDHSFDVFLHGKNKAEEKSAVSSSILPKSIKREKSIQLFSG